MGSITGGPTTANINPPAPVFGGMTQQYLSGLSTSGVETSSLRTLNDAAQTGLPTDVGPAFDAIKASMQHNVDEGARDLKEKFGGGMGLSGGSDILKAGADFTENSKKDMNSILAQLYQSSSESAANRRVDASKMGMSFFSEPALALAPTQVAGPGQGIMGAASQGAGTAAELAMLMGFI